MKRCGRCGELKALDAFHRMGTGHQHWCRACRKAYDAAYNKATLARRRERRRVRHAEFIVWYQELKSGKPCTDCGGIFHPAAMQWDHLPGTDKRADVGELARKDCRATVLAEIAKCELVCANCHAVRTFNRRRGVAQPG
jgi:hypothetical protein